MDRRSLLTLAAAACLPPVARAATLPASRSLKAELAAALAARKPLLVMASLDGCPWCRMVRDSFLAPLAREGQPIVQVDWGSKAAVEDFEGRSTTHAELFKAWKVEVMPTVLFFGGRGREVAQRLAGASIPDFYGAYLEERLRQATANLA